MSVRTRQRLQTWWDAWEAHGAMRMVRMERAMGRGALAAVVEVAAELESKVEVEVEAAEGRNAREVARTVVVWMRKVRVTTIILRLS